MREFMFVLFILSSEARRNSVGVPEREPDDDLAVARVDIFPPKFDEPVPFGHITREGFGDPYTGQKPPIDLLELSMVKPKSFDEIRILQQNGERHRIQHIDKPSIIAPNPRDAFIKNEPIPPEGNNTLKWYQLAETQRRNAMMPPKTTRLQAKPKNKLKVIAAPNPNPINKGRFFSNHSFELIGPADENDESNKNTNWTTCSEFGAGAYFLPKAVVGISWVPFFTWSIAKSSGFAQVHKFAYPTEKLVNEYKVKYSKYLGKPIDWNAYKLLMTEPQEYLLISADKRGLFDAIPRQEIPEDVIRHNQNITIPMHVLRMKLADSYLAFMYCNINFATIMAVSGTEPTSYLEMKSEAAVLKFRGIGRPLWRNIEAEKELESALEEIKLKEKEDQALWNAEPEPKT